MRLTLPYPPCKRTMLSCCLHYRFTWNWLAYRYYDGQRQFLDALARKHEDVSFHHLNLSQKYFVDQLVPVLDKLVCSLGTFNQCCTTLPL